MMGPTLYLFVLVPIAFLARGIPDRPAREVDEGELRLLMMSIEGAELSRFERAGAFEPAALEFYGRILRNQKEHAHIVQNVLALISSPKITADRRTLFPVIHARLADPYPGVRRSAVNLLARIGSVRDAPPIAALLADSDLTVTYAAAKALSEIGDRSCLVALDIWLNSDSHRDDKEIRDRVRRFRDALEARLDRTAPPPREVKR